MSSTMGPWEIGMIVIILIALALVVYVIYLIIRALKKYIS